MGSTDRSQDELIVLVTGFGVSFDLLPLLPDISPSQPRPSSRHPPTDTTVSQQPFKNDYPRNPSWDIVASLPTYLPIVNAKAPSALRATELPPVRIVVHPEPVRVTYSAVRELVPKLWKPEFSGVPRIDFVLHIGMASPRPQYVLEQVGDRDGYTLADLDNRLPDQNQSRPDWPWVGMPSQLTTELDVVDVRARWERHLPVSGRPCSGSHGAELLDTGRAMLTFRLQNNHIPLKISTNAGHFLCDYIYFNSLAECFKAQQRRTVAFLHVPAVKAEPEHMYNEAITTGREVAIQLIRSIMESELNREPASLTELS